MSSSSFLIILTICLATKCTKRTYPLPALRRRVVVTKSASAKNHAPGLGRWPTWEGAIPLIPDISTMPQPGAINGVMAPSFVTIRGVAAARAWGDFVNAVRKAIIVMPILRRRSLLSLFRSSFFSWVSAESGEVVSFESRRLFVVGGNMSFLSDSWRSLRSSDWRHVAERGGCVAVWKADVCKSRTRLRIKGSCILENRSSSWICRKYAGDTLAGWLWIKLACSFVLWLLCWCWFMIMNQHCMPLLSK
mmetsp:Transcript_24680/g.59517  ORF Transcript_24680/g.59517 Transcript_24680/m.59517 type:complete len:248 (-) Transcript_24680:42-785(-)